MKPLSDLIRQAGGQLVKPVYEPDVGAVLMAIRFHQPDYDLKDFHLQEE